MGVVEDKTIISQWLRHVNLAPPIAYSPPKVGHAIPPRKNPANECEVFTWRTGLPIFRIAEYLCCHQREYAKTGTHDIFEKLAPKFLLIEKPKLVMADHASVAGSNGSKWMYIEW